MVNTSVGALLPTICIAKPPSGGALAEERICCTASSLLSLTVALVGRGAVGGLEAGFEGALGTSAAPSSVLPFLGELFCGEGWERGVLAGVEYASLEYRAEEEDLLEELWLRDERCEDPALDLDGDV